MIKKILFTTTFLFLMPAMSFAQLAADPWANQSAAVEAQQNIPVAKAGNWNNDADNPWNTTQPHYIGDKTTWTEARGQAEIAPDVNITNMLLMSQHLRNMGYQIPEGLDNLITTAPAKLRAEIWESMAFLHNSNHPVATVSVGFSEIFEKKTGFSIENLIGNSLRLIDQRR